MPLELIGLFRTRHESEVHVVPSGAPPIDLDYTAALAQAYEQAGYDRVLVGLSSQVAENTQVAAYAAAHTERLSFMIAHRPGFVFPTVAARLFATFDQITKGRTALHTISGASDAEQRRDGDRLSKADRYARSEEFLQIVKKAWSDERFDFDGRFYQVEDYFSPVKPYQQPRIPVYFGGSSAEAFRVGAAEADVYMFYGLPLDELEVEFDKLRRASAEIGRDEPPRFGVTFRPILGATEDAAWERAHQILDRVERNAGAKTSLLSAFTDGQQSAGAERAAESAKHNAERSGPLWMRLAAAKGAVGNSAPLVGTAETVAKALLEYVDLGATTFIIHGYDPLDDVVAIGRDLVPLLRAGVAERDRGLVAS